MLSFPYFHLHKNVRTSGCQTSYSDITKFSVFYSNTFLATRLLCSRIFSTPVFVWDISPIGKPKKVHTMPCNYRPITLLPIVSKVFEKLILSRMLDFEKESPILRDQQFGFRSKQSTTQQVLCITETIALRRSRSN